MREPRLLNESDIKEIEDLLLDDNIRVNWKDGVLEDYWYTKDLLLAKEREKEEKKQRKREEFKMILFLSTFLAIILTTFVIGLFSK